MGRVLICIRVSGPLAGSARRQLPFTISTPRCGRVDVGVSGFAPWGRQRLAQGSICSGRQVQDCRSW